jgi:phage gp36-like protein
VYSTTDDILKKIPEAKLAQLTSEEGTEVDDAIVEDAIASADAVIDSYAAIRHKVPFDPVPARVRESSVKIATYMLHSRRADEMGGVGETIRQEYEDEISFWKDVAVGRATVGEDPPPAASSMTGGVVKASERVFTNDSMKGL